jgi:hypothetical protein
MNSWWSPNCGEISLEWFYASGGSILSVAMVKTFVEAVTEIAEVG